MTCPKCGANGPEVIRTDGFDSFECGSYYVETLLGAGLSRSEKCKLNQAREMLQRMSGWDQMQPYPMTGDHAFWLSEIQKCLKDTE